MLIKTNTKFTIQIFRDLIKIGDGQGARSLLREARWEDIISPTTTARIGALLNKLPTAADTCSQRLKLHACGQCTISWVLDCLRVMSWEEGIWLDITEGEFDNVMQDLIVLAETGQRVDILMLMPWCDKYINESTLSKNERIEEFIVFWKNVWEKSKTITGKVMQVGCDLIGVGAMGYGLGAKDDNGPLCLMRTLNREIRKTIPDGVFFIDLERIAGQTGRSTFYSRRRYYWTRQPFSERGSVDFAKHLNAGIRALTIGPKKVLVLDLDNTVWGGIVGEEGPLGISLGEDVEGEAYRAFQMYCKKLAARGVLLAVASKNNEKDAKAPFLENPNMVLKIDDIASFQACWKPKSWMMRQIANDLNLGMNSFVFVDDNRAECEEVHQNASEVIAIHLPPDQADYVGIIEDSLYFESVALTNEDADRTRKYRAEAKRKTDQSLFNGIDEYLRSLNMRGMVEEINENSIQRVVQLLGKTNQFNLTTRRHDKSTVLQFMAKPDTVGITANLCDKFGDYGLTGIIIAVPDEIDTETLVIDTFLMSCRVINRGMEKFIFDVFLKKTKKQGIKRLRAIYIPTTKNSMVANLYDSFGFKRRKIDEKGVVEFEEDIEKLDSGKYFIEYKDTCL